MYVRSNFNRTRPRETPTQTRKPNVLLNIYISNRIRHLEWNSIMNRSYTHFPYKMYFKWSHDVVGEQSRDHWNI